MDLTQIDARHASEDAATEVDERSQRLGKQVAAVRRRSRLIHSLRTFLPGAIIGLIVLNFGWIIVTSIINSMNVYDGNSNEIRMTNPRYHGQTGKGEHYTISGLEAVRRGKDATTVMLKSPVMEFKGDADGTTRVAAVNGVFDQQSRKFIMTGNVLLVTGGSDFTFKTEEAIVDLDNSTVYGDKHVEGTSSVGHIVGESFVISDNGNSVRFTGRGDAQVKAEMK
ncbi:hypothetical protein ABI_02140 [Asticcacaulis biprosthecium C19]|uniref:Lipopolysaccharide-assembly, LptC-related family protein n=1 Tax=Asticcacaulis biprosthecium C19 TaxID=715226 RepID=F4QIM4_9CAUL|nr:LPS export ABC transporter periplasmic protein LptC [Asticcacaulis biprosthecium]EGF91783.1 hypothetical protein ABI_02140 [Asticcacaulis biprosthecium C19]